MWKGLKILRREDMWKLTPYDLLSEEKPVAPFLPGVQNAAKVRDTVTFWPTPKDPYSIRFAITLPAHLGTKKSDHAPKNTFDTKQTKL